MSYKYQLGWGNHFSTEAVEGALPPHQNSPQVPPLGLYAEQLSGTAFTAPRANNERSWLYRIRPVVGHNKFKPLDKVLGCVAPTHANVEQIRWKPFEMPSKPTDFLEGMNSLMHAGDPSTKSGICIYALLINKSMEDSAFCNADGDFLFVAQEGTLDFVTE